MSNVVPLTAARTRRRGAPAARRPERPAGALLVPTMVDSWRIALEAADKSPRTIGSYTRTVELFAGWLEATGRRADTEIEAEDVRLFLSAERERTSAASAAVHFRNLRVFWGWVAKEGERTFANPMVNVEPPKVAEKVKTYFDDDQLATLLKTCGGSSFEDRRDQAIMRVLIDTGVRVGGLVSIRFSRTDESINDVFLREKRLRIVLKGGDEHLIPLGKKAVQALDRYLRARDKHPKGPTSPFLFLGVKGRDTSRMTESGVYQMIRRRGEQAGISDAHPHRFRRTFADQYLEGGGTVDGVMAVAGWKSYEMVRKYAGDRAMERARKLHERLSPGDRI